jgi:hypothetical protein
MLPPFSEWKASVEKRSMDIGRGMVEKGALREQVKEEKSTKLWQFRKSVVRFEVFTAVTMKNGVFWDVTPLALVRIDVSEELSAFFIRVTRIGELGTTLAVTSNRRTLRRSR